MLTIWSVSMTYKKMNCTNCYYNRRHPYQLKPKLSTFEFFFTLSESWSYFSVLISGPSFNNVLRISFPLQRILRKQHSNFFQKDRVYNRTDKYPIVFYLNRAMRCHWVNFTQIRCASHNFTKMNLKGRVKAIFISSKLNLLFR